MKENEYNHFLSSSSFLPMIIDTKSDKDLRINIRTMSSVSLKRF